MVPGNEFYSEEDVQAILRLASQSSTQAGMSREQLLQMATELGLSEDAVMRAEGQLSKVKADAELKAQESQDREKYRREVTSGVRGHVISYLAVNAGLIVTWAATTTPPTHDFWPIFPLAGWGFGLVSHLVSVLNKGAFEEGFQKWQRERALREMGRQLRIQQPQRSQGAPMEGFLAQLADGGVRSRLEAIKVYREVTGCDLMTAKQIVDDYAVRNPNAFR